MKIFISYSSKDRELINKLSDDLELLDHNVWFDRELNRRGGHKWWKLICKEIRDCEAFIYALSPYVVHSIPCQREYSYARSLGKPVLPLIVSSFDFRYLPRELQESQLLDFSKRTFEQRRGLRDSLRNLPTCPPLPASALELEPAVPLDSLGVLIDRIRNLTSDPNQQKLLILDIDELQDDNSYSKQVPELLKLLAKRDDVLTVRNLHRIEKMLAKLSEINLDIINSHQESGIVRSPAVSHPMNLNFNGPFKDGQPQGWFNSLGFVANVSTAYQTKIVRSIDTQHKFSISFQNPDAKEDAFGSLMQRCPAQFLAGRAIRFEGEVKTDNIEKWAGLWLRVDGEEGFEVFFDNMYNRPIIGTTKWTKYTIETQLSQPSVWLNYGIVLVGKGILWAANFRLLVWDGSKWSDI